LMAFVMVVQNILVAPFLHRQTSSVDVGENHRTRALPLARDLDK
jgi:hypothetical protein